MDIDAAAIELHPSPFAPAVANDISYRFEEIFKGDAPARLRVRAASGPPLVPQWDKEGWNGPCCDVRKGSSTMIRHLMLSAVLAGLAAASVAHAADAKPASEPAATVTYSQGKILEPAGPFLHNSELPVITSTAIHPGTSHQPGLNCTFCSSFSGGVGWHPG
jgi:hypothetical protein